MHIDFIPIITLIAFVCQYEIGIKLTVTYHSLCIALCDILA